MNPRKSGDDRKSGTRIAAPDQTLLAVFRSDANGHSVALCQRRQPPKAGAVGQRLQRVAGQSSWTIKNDGWFRITQVRLTRERPYAKTVRLFKTDSSPFTRGFSRPPTPVSVNDMKISTESGLTRVHKAQMIAQWLCRRGRQQARWRQSRYEGFHECGRQLPRGRARQFHSLWFTVSGTPVACAANRRRFASPITASLSRSWTIIEDQIDIEAEQIGRLEKHATLDLIGPYG